MTEKEAKLLTKLRTELGDKEEPYRYPDSDLLDLLTEAVSDYSKYRPRQARGTISIVPGQQEYQLPAEYQTWVSGLSGYDIFDRTLLLSCPPAQSYDITFTYLADHTIESLPEREWSLLLDYAMWKLLDGIVREGAEISALKLGKGLEIKFDNFDKIAQESTRRYERYQKAVTRPVGGWS